jgi:PRC-barrel domain
MHSPAASTPSAHESHRLIASDKVEGTKVRRPNGQTVGEIMRVMIEKRTGQVAYAVMSFGGFLGIGSDFYPLPWDRLTYNPRLDAYELDITEEQLRKAPKFDKGAASNWSAEEGKRISDYYNLPMSGM